MDFVRRRICAQDFINQTIFVDMFLTIAELRRKGFTLARSLRVLVNKEIGAYNVLDQIVDAGGLRNVI